MFAGSGLTVAGNAKQTKRSRIVNRTHPYSALHKPKGTPVCARSGERVGHPPRIESALNLPHSPALEEQCFAKCDSR